ncbi:hypothetical protein N0V93_009335 [Gnomoniopsis smithogilvyi]|uniref:Uncharacterized protein n=1 Tax=Gnomoniopsis smithogilvyi TaxID=1191159 RepID=A0A9W8YKK4_9PEZI|nr:hypothetical protein N0V93_009335 [Gnomoniopsis smithogilvyi]
MGLFKLLCSSKVSLSTRFWVLLRGCLITSIWLSGIVLFYKTSNITLYDTIYKYDVTAGVGSFNASLVQPFINYLQGLSPNYPYTVLPYTQYAAAYTLVLNPLIATVSEPVACISDAPGDCMSYLFSGGLEMVTPWIPKQDTDYPMVKIDNVQAVQMDFSGSTSIDTRLSLCNGTTGGICGSYGMQYNITSRVSFFSRQATLTTARSNYSILSVVDTSAPEPIIDVDVTAYRAALGWLLNYTSADIPGPSSIAQSFWSSNLRMQDPSTYGIIVQNFQSVLAFPFWLFNDNNWGNTALKSNQTVAGLPQQFYTQASIVAPYQAIEFNQGMFIVFVVLQGLGILFAWGTLFWVWICSRVQPETSGFLLFEAKYRNKRWLKL